MQRKIITTADGSKTIQIEEWNEQYHSVHGAIQEANYVYIEQGLLFSIDEFQKSSISILEIGFGTGLNTLLTLLTSQKLNQNINYVGIEAYPVKSEELQLLDYSKYLDISGSSFESIHESSWEEEHVVSKHFKLRKQKKFFNDISEINAFDVIYYDAFGARVQPELWTEVLFEKMYKALKPNGVLVTYSAKGSVKRALVAVGFTIERLKGPPGKRHMLRAIKR